MIIYPYRIEECGLYEWGSESPKFGLLQEFLPDFVKWINEKEGILNTATFRDEENSIPRIFCLEAFSDNAEQEYGIVLWNESPQHDEGVLSIPIQSKVGDVTASATPMPGESIPGWPTYLWIDVKNSLIISLVPDNMRGYRNSGIKPARKYFKEYLRLKSRYVVLETSNESLEVLERDVLGWKDESTTTSRAYSVKFNTKELMKPGNLERIRSKHSSIYKVISKSSLRTEIPVESSLLNKITNFLNIDVSRRNEYTTKFKSEIDMKMDREGVDQLISGWEQRINEDDVDYQIGVKFQGDSGKTHWFDKARGRFEQTISPDLEKKYLWREEEVREAWSIVAREVIDIHKRSIQ